MDSAFVMLILFFHSYRCRGGCTSSHRSNPISFQQGVSSQSLTLQTTTPQVSLEHPSTSTNPTAYVSLPQYTSTPNQSQPVVHARHSACTTSLAEEVGAGGSAGIKKRSGSFCPAGDLPCRTAERSPYLCCPEPF
ncbi:hypothetical protein K458DRAFT_46232 [Lentithecium fluviatile CBS 122367]|uniref:Uncharacterized protein n=1 Tax=Lentithecium fluviatile CBS 122367 TaxID=1168545 RepID=A0A6G1IZQ1_9PLEO|nr:hypothetical protein K458DRAFT_46232 [Lentithecium fluviatile CBS 122367]